MSKTAKSTFVIVFCATASCAALAAAAIEDDLVYFEMTAFADVDSDSSNGQYYVIQIVDPIFVPLGTTVIVPGSSPGINAFRLSSSVETTGGMREIMFEMKVADGPPSWCFNVFECGGAGDYVDWPGVPDSNRWWGHTYTIGIPSVDGQQVDSGVYDYIMIKNSPFGTPNTEWRLINDGFFAFGRDLLWGPSSSYKRAVGSGPFSNGSEGNTTGYRFVYTYPISDEQPCNQADLSEPRGLLDLSDITMFSSMFVAGADMADLNGDGLHDLADVNLFVNGFVSGCP